MAEDQEKAIARERMDKRIAMFLVGPVGLIVGFWSLPLAVGIVLSILWRGALESATPSTVFAKLICLTIGAVTAFAAANGYYKVMQGRYMFGKKKD